MSAREIALWRHLDGIADAEERAELSRALASDPEFCAEYLAICRLHAELGEQRIAARPPSGAHPITGPRAIPSAPSRTSPQWVVLALAALLMLAIGAAWWGWSPASPVILADVSGSDRIIHPGDHVQAGDQELTLTLRGSGVRLRLAAGGHMVADPTWRLTSGVLHVEVPAQPADHPLRIQTPHALAEVLGTAFRLQVAENSTHLQVTTGTVRLRTASEERICAAGEDLLAAPGQPLIGGPLPPPGTVLARFSFDAAEPPPRWNNVTMVDAGPGRPGRCISAEPHAGAGNEVLAARWQDWREGLFQFDERLVLTGWVWIEPSNVRWVDVWVGHMDGTARNVALNAVPRGRWWRIVVPFSELKRLGDTSPTRDTRPGELIAAVFFQAFRTPGARLLVDDVRLILRY